MAPSPLNPESPTDAAPSTSIRRVLKELARWCAILLSAVVGLFIFVGYTMGYIATHEWSIPAVINIVIFEAALASPFFLITHACWRRRYEQVATITIFVGCVLFCWFLIRR